MTRQPVIKFEVFRGVMASWPQLFAEAVFSVFMTLAAPTVG